MPQTPLAQGIVGSWLSSDCVSHHIVVLERRRFDIACNTRDNISEIAKDITASSIKSKHTLRRFLHFVLHPIPHMDLLSNFTI